MSCMKGAFVYSHRRHDDVRDLLANRLKDKDVYYDVHIELQVLTSSANSSGEAPLHQCHGARGVSVAKGATYACIL